MAQRPSGSLPTRLARAFRHLTPEQRLAGYGAVALFVTMFLPWYSKSAVGVSRGQPVKVDDSLSAWGAFSFVEAAILLVAVFILVMLFQRGEDRPFHLPGGDGTVITGAGVWVALLVFYRQFDKPDAGKVSGIATTVGVEWGIFLTLLVGLLIAYAGQRLRVAHVAEPPNAAARPRTGAAAPTRVEAARQRAAPPRPAPSPEQLSFEEPPQPPADPDEQTAATRVAPPEARPRPRRPLPWEEDGPPEFDQHPRRDR